MGCLVSENEHDVALEFIQRKLKNLEYFKKYRPAIYNYFRDYEPSHCELVLTPGSKDVDLLDKGHSFYKGLAKEYSCNEAQDFAEKNANGNAKFSYQPPWFAQKSTSRFAKSFLKKSVEASNLTPQTYAGYRFDGVIPSVIFLGCGLGYHIEKLVEIADVVNAVVFEPDPDRFALSLFTVDWEEICKKFRARGRSIEFSVASRPDDLEHLKRVMTSTVMGLIPLYPYFTLFYNHLVSVELFRLSQELEKDLPVLSVNWADYDTQLFPYRNAYHNIKRASLVLDPRSEEEDPRPLVIVGSGPSLDSRIDDLKKVRDRVIVVSAGTSLRALLGHGVRPDYHVELDPSNIIHGLLTDIEKEFGLHDIVLIHCLTVNPSVPSLFQRAVPFFNASNYISALFQLSGLAVPGATATCTNAALAVSYFAGARNIFLFGTDYGYKDKSQTHSNRSVYGNRSGVVSEQRLSEGVKANRRSAFKTVGVNGTEVITQADYYTAKQKVEHFIQDVARAEVVLSVWNCSDGAEIVGAEWLSSDSFLRAMDEFDATEFLPGEFFEVRAQPLPALDVDKRYRVVAHEVEEMCNDLRAILNEVELTRRADLMVAANEVRICLNRVGGGSGRRAESIVQLMSWSVLHGVIQHFLQVGLCHGLAQEEQNLVTFLNRWRSVFLEFLHKVPGHFTMVTCSDIPPSEDPWVNSWVDEDEKFDSP